MGVPRPRTADHAPAVAPLDPQAWSDVADYIGTSRAAVAALWPQMVTGWGAYLTSGRYGHDTVQDIVAMEAIVQAGLDSYDS